MSDTILKVTNARRRIDLSDTTTFETRRPGNLHVQQNSKVIHLGGQKQQQLIEKAEDKKLIVVKQQERNIQTEPPKPEEVPIKEIVKIEDPVLKVPVIEQTQVSIEAQKIQLQPASIQIPEKQIDFLLKPTSKRKQYYSRPPCEKEEIVHWGQRKLLIAETWFLTNYGHLSKNVIYVGAAPGLHIDILQQMFKTHMFYLFDAADFQVKENQNIKINKTYFTDEHAKQFKDSLKNDYLFISDIRTANFRSMTPLENEQAVLNDNRFQMTWHDILGPKKSFLKFRCAYPTEIKEPTEFFYGDIFIQPWAPASSTETRLVPSGRRKKYYDNVEYEEQMFYHNDVERKQKFKKRTWDEQGEVQILEDYIRKIPNGQMKLQALQDLISKKLEWH